MAYIPSECSLEEYERVIYSGDAKNRLYVKHGDTIIGTNGDNNASPFASKLTIKRRILKNGSKTITLNNFISQEIDLVLHDYKIEDLSEEIEIKIGTFIDSVNDYVYVPIGKFLIQDNPTTDKNKTTYKLRDFSIKFDFYYNAKPLIDANGGKATKLQILKDICEQAGVVCKIKSFVGYNDEIGIYDNSITARTYITYIAEQAGKMASINRYGELIFVDITSDESSIIGTNEITLENAVEKRIDSFIIEGNSKQDTSPSPDYPSEIETVKGYENKFNKNDYVQGWLRYSDNELVDPTQTTFYSTGFIEVKGNTNHIIDFYNQTSLNSGGIMQYDENKNWLGDGIAETEQVMRFKTKPSTKYVRFVFRIDAIDNIRFMEGTELKPYVPYGNNYLVNKIIGKQLFNKNDITTDYLVSRDDGTLISNNGYISTKFIEVKPNEVYNIYQFNTWYSACYDENYNFLGFPPIYYDNITTLPNTKYIRCSLEKTYLDTAQIEIGNEYTGYEEYKETQISYNLQGNELVAIGNIKDELDIVTGALTKRIGKVVLNGSESWEYRATRTNTSIFVLLNYVDDMIKEQYVYDVLCDYFSSSNVYSNDQVGYFLHYDANKSHIYMSLDNVIASDLSSFISWLSNNPVTLYYELAQPEIIQLDATEIKTFEGTNYITTYTGLETNISLDYASKKHVHNISPNIVEKFTAGDMYKVSKLLFEAGVNKFEDGTDDNDTLYLNSDNPYINQQTQINNIFPNVKGFEINSFKTGKILGNPAIDPADLIKIEYDGIIYKTLAQYTLKFGGTMTSNYETTVEHEAKQSNVTNSGMASLKKYVKAELDNVNAEFSVQVGELSSGIDDLETNINNTADRVSNTESKLNDTNTNLENLVGRTTQLEQDAKSWTFEFTNIYEDLSALEQKTTETDATTKEIKDYIKFVDGNIILEGTNSKCSVVISKEKISFYTNGNESAYISNNELYITDNTVLNKQTIGKWELKPDSEGNLNTRWIG